jgi:site-specific recombinase XerD
MRDATLIGPWVRRFLLEHVITDRNFARNTQVSYRDALVLLLPFLSDVRHKGVDRLTIDDLSPPVVRSFLEYLEKERGCCGTTRNLRLATIHSLAKFIAMHCPEQVSWYAAIRTVPFKKTAKSTLNYLDKDEMDVLLKTPNLEMPQGARDHALLLFLYNSGARADEAAHLSVADITWGSAPSVRLTGKGNKTRRFLVVVLRTSSSSIDSTNRSRVSESIAWFVARSSRPPRRCHRSRTSESVRTA